MRRTVAAMADAAVERLGCNDNPVHNATVRTGQLFDGTTLQQWRGLRRR
jgi:hypothetical protein